MEQPLRAGLVQLNAGPEIEDNLRQADRWIREAARLGAQFICTPENTCRMRSTVEGRLASAYPVETHPAIPFFMALSRELRIHLLVGSISSILVEDRKLANRSFLFGPQGEIIATYDKMHMFDVDLPNGEKYRESETNRPGENPVLADMGGIKVGLSVCYDLRFPSLYRHLAKQDAKILTIPSAFTVPTGKAHWHVLLRARAIENGAFVLAPAQGGVHEGGRATYGYSLAVNPWGEIIAEIQGDKPGITVFDVDLELVRKARESIPSLRHDRVL